MMRSHFFLFAVCCALFVCSAGCSARESTRAVLNPRPDSQPLRIAVVPFQRILPDESARTVCCPLTGIIFRSCASERNSERLLEKAFFAKFKKYERNLIPPDKVEGVFRRVSADSFKPNPGEILRKVGHELEVDYLIAGHLFCLRERKGFSYSVEKPAMASFGIYLIRASDGSIVWKGIFDKAQKSLFEDILQLSSFVRERGRWVQAEELMLGGMEEVLQTFPELD